MNGWYVAFRKAHRRQRVASFAKHFAFAITLALSQLIQFFVAPLGDQIPLTLIFGDFSLGPIFKAIPSAFLLGGLIYLGIYQSETPPIPTSGNSVEMLQRGINSIAPHATPRADDPLDQEIRRDVESAKRGLEDLTRALPGRVRPIEDHR